MTFTHPLAFEQLRDEGFVVSFRADERERTPRDGSQMTWVNRGRGETKEFDVLVQHLGTTGSGPTLFRHLWPMSGFPDPDGWMLAIREFHGGLPDTGHFYMATRGELA